MTARLDIDGTPVSNNDVEVTSQNSRPVSALETWRHPHIGGSIDLLSLDVDGNDYWTWRARQCIRPRVVIPEFNAACGPDRSLTIAYQPDFRLDLSVQPYRCGASLQAFVKLGKLKGYRLVGVESRGINAFFVRDGVGEALLPERSARECFEQTGPLMAWQPAWLDAMLSGTQEWQDV